MGSVFAGERPNIPGRHFRNPCVDAARRVVGFDLSARGGKSWLAADSDKNLNGVSAERQSADCGNPCWIHPTTLKNSSLTVSSPRSALQQLLLPENGIADPPSFLSAYDRGIRVWCEPASSQAPTARQPIAGGATTHFSDINNRRQAIISTPANRSKKSSFFILPATSLISETSQHCSHRPGADNHQCKLKSRVVDMEFLDACFLCKRRLGQGRDLFMYSGDKAFCSTECRDHQIVTDMRMERCTPRIIRAGASMAFRRSMASNTSNVSIKQQRATSSIKPISINKHNLINHATAA